MSGAPRFEHFNLIHWAVLATFPALGALLSLRPGRMVRRSLALALLGLEVWWFFRMLSYGVGWRNLLPLQLSDASILLAVFTVWTANRWAYDILYYWGLTVMPLAMLTPDLQEPFPATDTVIFFLLHGLVVSIVLYLLWSGTLRPRPGSMWRSLAVLNLFLVLVLAANGLLGTNYMYVMEKPSQPSPLDYMGPWPVYILTGEVVALVAFYVLKRLCERLPAVPEGRAASL